jgi:hypothetical protein
MISLTCTHCQTVLSIDDAFAGGVCRCQHCGTIQTVPSRLKAGAVAGAGVNDSSSALGQKALYQSHRGPGAKGSDELGGSGTGLEDLADVVASSGLGGSGLSSSIKSRKVPRRPAASAVAVAPARSKPTVLVAAGAAIALVIGIGIWWFSTSGSRQVETAPPSPTADGAPAAVAGPQFCGIPLSGNSIVFLLDRGDSAKEVFDAMKEATYNAIQSLGSDRKFQVLLWDNNTSPAGYPSDSTTFATKENIDACRHALEDVTAEHQSSVEGPLTHAVAEAPDAIVMVTAKGFELDDSFVNSVQSIIQKNPIKLFTVSIGTESSALQTLAKQGGGIYKSVSQGALRSAGGE